MDSGSSGISELLNGAPLGHIAISKTVMGALRSGNPARKGFRNRAITIFVVATTNRNTI